jgi:hypothetical protein
MPQGSGATLSCDRLSDGGAASHDQVAQLLPGSAGSLVLVTSRRRLAALQDATVISLDTLAPQEAGALLIRLAGGPELRPGNSAVREITRLCGYLPLAIGMLAAQLRHHSAWTPAGLAASLAQAADRLALMHAENLSIAAAFDLSYQDLTVGQQRLFRRLGLVPGPGIDAYAAAALDGTSLEEARGCLDELYDQHLLTEPAPGHYQLHDLLREHAHTLAAADAPAESGAATGRLLDYYLLTAAANRLTAQRPPPAIPPVACPPATAPQLASQKQALAWLQTERASLQSCADYAASHGLAVHAVWLPAQLGDFLRMHGYLDQALALHQAAAQIAQAAGDRAGQATALRSLGYIRRLLGQHSARTRRSRSRSASRPVWPGPTPRCNGCMPGSASCQCAPAARPSPRCRIPGWCIIRGQRQHGQATRRPPRGQSQSLGQGRHPGRCDHAAGVQHPRRRGPGRRRLDHRPRPGLRQPPSRSRRPGRQPLRGLAARQHRQ